MVYKVLRAIIALCLISVGSGMLVVTVSLIAGWESQLDAGTAEIAYGLYGVVICALAQTVVSLVGKARTFMVRQKSAKRNSEQKLSPKRRGKK